MRAFVRRDTSVSVSLNSSFVMIVRKPGVKNASSGPRRRVCCHTIFLDGGTADVIAMTRDSADVALDAQTVRADFPYLEEPFNGHPFAYLDSAASAQKPRQVLEAMDEFYSHSYANAHRGVYQLAERATAALELAREKTRAFINAQAPREVIFVRNTT